MIKGSCLCRKIAFEITGPIVSPRYCHCENCRKFSGTGYAAWGVVRSSELVVTRYDSGTTKYDSGGGLRVFCSSCGSPLWFEPRDLQQFRGIPLGAIDVGDVPTPEMQVWTKSKASWSAVLEGIPHHETHP